MPAYDQSYRPPAPVAVVSVAHPLTGTRRGSERGKLDTGAALTVIPRRLVFQLSLSPHGEVWARGYDDSYSQRSLYYVRLVLEEYELPVVECVAADRETVLVGRNVLNHFVVTLDGRNLRFELKRG